MHLAMYIDGKEAVSCEDDSYSCGACGYVVDEGAIVANEFTIRAL